MTTVLLWKLQQARKAGFSVEDSFLAGQTISRDAGLCGIGVVMQGGGDGADLHPGQSSEVYLQVFAPSQNVLCNSQERFFNEHSAW